MVFNVSISIFYYALVVGALGVVSLLCFIGGRRIRKYVDFYRANPEAGPEPPELDVWPKATVVVPATGTDPTMYDALCSIARLDYPDFEVIFVTESEDDPAVSVIRDVLDCCIPSPEDRPVLKHVVAGKATSCGQKNFNQLAGIREGAGDSEVLVFFDSTHVLPSKLMRNLLAPIARGEAETVTGYHHVRTRTMSVPAVGRCVTVLMMYMMQEVPIVTQPWGGNMAISKKAFREMGIGEMWAENLVDDVSLAQRLAERKRRTHSVVGACQITEIESLDFRTWMQWLKRQWVYLRIYFHFLWTIAGGLCLVVLLATYGAPLLILWGMATGAIVSLALPAIIYLVLLMGCMALTRRYHPWPGKLHVWIMAGMACIVVGFLTHMQTWGMKDVCWRHYCYKVGPKGKVLGIREQR